MCGNAIRCVGKYLYDNKIVEKNHLTIETLSGIKKLELKKQNGEVQFVTVDMGKAELDPKKIPVSLDGDKVVDVKVEIGGRKENITCVSMGNPHCVVFYENIDTLNLEEIGPKFENNKIFPDRVNTEFIKVIDGHTLKMRVWERGSGETWACGTGACAAAVAAVENGYCKKGDDITIKLIGGELVIKYTDGGVFMTGGASKVFDGEIEI